MLLGCIADDFTGATDLATCWCAVGCEQSRLSASPLGHSVERWTLWWWHSNRALFPQPKRLRSPWPRSTGSSKPVAIKSISSIAPRLNSTPLGNIGPVTDALMSALKTSFTIACPAFPEAGRTICRGHLFVGNALLSELGTEDHPLTPMTDANLVRVLQAQTRRKVGLITYDTLAQGPAALRERTAVLRREGFAIAIVDALAEADLHCIAEGCSDLPLVTAGSGVGLGIAEHHRRTGRLDHAASAASLPRVAAYSAIVSGSCSVATNGQVAHWMQARPALRIDPLRLAAGLPVVQEALAWLSTHLQSGPVLIYATSTPQEVKAVQRELGVDRAGALIEQALAQVAEGLVAAGVRNLVVAGGETSGAVVSALGIRALRIGPQIDPGVPWTESLDDEPIALALKSGNFGSVDFFSKALKQIEQQHA